MSFLLWGGGGGGGVWACLGLGLRLETVNGCAGMKEEDC